ncbi:hypothetical protein [Escherichia coli]|uniref:hypothetical protein n=1 Tax=Escherichia coli TaxID=562 RepID=UPI00217F1E19|nr:hypothetical protein [Escherichia coli]
MCADLGNRYFGTVTEALELDTAKNGYILLVQDAEPNFDVNGNSPVTPDGWIATWNLRLAMEKEFPDEEWRSADLRKILMELAKDGAVSKDTYASRIGQAVWRLEVR